MTISIKEREYWNSRVAAMFTQAIKELEQREALLLDRLRAEATAQAREELGVAEAMQQLEALIKEHDEIESQIKHTANKIYEFLTGQNIGRSDITSQQSRINFVIDARGEKIHKHLCAEHPVAGWIARYNKMKQTATNGIMLAKNNAELRHHVRRALAALDMEDPWDEL